MIVGETYFNWGREHLNNDGSNTVAAVKDDGDEGSLGNLAHEKHLTDRK